MGADLDGVVGEMAVKVSVAPSICAPGGAIYDFDDHNHLLVSLGTGLQNASDTNRFSWYLGYQITGP